MKNYIILLLSIVVCSNTFGQSSFDLDGIKKVVLDTTSSFSYNSLVAEFNHNPSGLDITQGADIYYGKLFTKDYKPYKINFDGIDFSKLVSKKKYKQAIPKGEEIIKSNPVNLEILSELFICYNKAGLTDSASLTKAKLDLLISSILSHGSGQYEENTLKVISVGDEYAMMRMLGISGLSRKSTLKGGSAFDTWKAKDPKGKRIDFFVEVIYEFTNSVNDN